MLEAVFPNEFVLSGEIVCENVGVQVFVTVCLINVNVEDGVELRDNVLVWALDTDTVEVALCETLAILVLDCCIEPVTVRVINGLIEFFNDADIVPESDVVFDWVIELVWVLEAVDVFDCEELPVLVELELCDFDWIPEAVNEVELDVEGVCKEEGFEIAVFVLDKESVNEFVSDLEIRAVTEPLDESVDVLLEILVTVCVDETVEVPVNLFTVSVGVREFFKDLVILGVNDIQGVAVDVLLEARDFVFVMVALILTEDVAVAVCDLVIGPDLVNVVDAVDVFVEPIVLVSLGEAVDVLDESLDEVPVLEDPIVLVIAGVFESDEDEVEVLEPLSDLVPQGELDDVFDTIADLEFVGVELEVLVCVVEDVCVLEEVWVLEEVVLPVFVFDKTEEIVENGDEEDVLERIPDLVKILVGFIVKVGAEVGVINDDGLTE